MQLAFISNQQPDSKPQPLVSDQSQSLRCWRRGVFAGHDHAVVRLQQVELFNLVKDLELLASTTKSWG